MSLWSMKQFTKIPSIVQILVAEWLAVMFVFPVVSKLYERINPSVGFQSLPLDKTSYVFFVIGLLLYFWLLCEILRPRVKTDSWISLSTFSDSGGSYHFSSTHPSYVFVDVMACGFWWFTRWLWSEGWAERKYQGTILVTMSVTIPILRLLAWYVLRLRPKDEDGKELVDEYEDSWKPVAALYIVILGIAGVTAAVVIPMERSRNRQQAEKEAALSVVDVAGWNGSQTFEALRDPDSNLDGQTATRVVRLRATQKSSEALTCTNDAGQGEFGTVLATLGKYDDVLIFSYSGVTELVQRASGNKDKPIEVIGRLTPMPKRPPTWKKYCGLDELSPRPRWVFVEERP